MMELGFVSAILGDLSFEEVISFASDNGFSCVEIMCWPSGKAERKYAGVTHVDVSGMDEKKAAQINTLLKAKGIKISSLGYYPNPLDPDEEKRNFYITHIEDVIKASSLLGINLVTTFIGRNKNKTVEDNLNIFKEVWTPLIDYAEKQNVKIAIENCPMLFTRDEWPGGLNLATSPAVWRKMFEAIPSPNFGLNYDPSHFVWQQMDYVAPIYEFANKLFHVHFKDVKIYKDKLDQVGIMAAPLEYMAPKLPGLGDVNWSRFVSALTDIGYRGAACIEVEDRAFEDSLESRKKSIILSKNYLNQYVI
jgi:sugar phosphate isomerase/epimerase